MKRRITTILLVLLAAMLLTACSAKPDSANGPGAESYEDFIGKTIGVDIGTISDTVTQEDLKGTPAYYSDTFAGLQDVRQGRIDGHMSDLSVVRILTAEPGNEDLEYFPIPEDVFSGPMGAYSVEQTMIDRFNAFLAKVEADGTLAEMQARWLEDVPDLLSPMPDVASSGENGTLHVATTGTALPFSYVGENGELKGYSVELAMRFAAHEGMRVEFAEMEFSAMIPYVVAERADLGIANVSITEERKKSVIFSEPIYNDQLGIVALSSGAVSEAKSVSFFEWLNTGFENNLIKEDRWKLILDGLGVTMAIALLAQLFGTALACLVCWVLTRKNKILRVLGDAYCGLIHGTPIVVLLMITYYIIFGNSNMSGVWIAIAAFTMVTGATVAEDFKGAMETVDPVEVEAARAMGFTATKAFFAVTLPQSIRRVLPSYTNGFVELVKATAIVGYIAIQDLTRAGDLIRSRTYDAFFPLIFVALVYLLVTTFCVLLFRRIVRRS